MNFIEIRTGWLIRPEEIKHVFLGKTTHYPEGKPLYTTWAINFILKNEENHKFMNYDYKRLSDAQDKFDEIKENLNKI